ncbi:beta-ketoacyl-[acyl-carrier-protein] synthase family protein [Streptomyces ziwulingensis]|uniref:Beta-ketoacyl-[acyl-carrier-protein] synthase family protein n=1 Tax=Streptomyces ziwulingensis TaxID=1045501 RepID=A0ABP9C0W8_9ACTN
MSGSRGVVVTGLGMVTPAGVGVAPTWQRVRSGVSTAGLDPELKGLPVDFSCRVPHFDATAHLGHALTRTSDRHVQFALLACEEAIGDARLVPADWEPCRVSVVIGSGMSGVGNFITQHLRFLDKGPRHVSPHLTSASGPSSAVGLITLRYGITGPAFSVSTACATGATAIAVAAGLLRAGVCDVALAGAADAPVVPLLASGFAQMRALSRRCDEPGRASRPFDRERDGFVLGEGAAVLVLETEAHARARQAPARARLIGTAMTSDAYDPVRPDPEGRAAETAIRRALDEAGAHAGEVDHVNSHGTSTVANDAVEARLIRRVLHSPSVTATKGALGHSLGAAAAIEAACTVLTVQSGIIPPTANLTEQNAGEEVDLVTGTARRGQVSLALSHSFGFGGHNAVLAFGRV